MFQVRFHGRGGQGVVTAAEMLSVAAFLEGKNAQAFPSFGSERMGAPVVSFCRIDDKEIRLRDPIDEPDALIIQDPTLLSSPDLFSGLKDDGYVILNTGKSVAQVGLSALEKRLPPGHLLTLPATEFALKHIKRPLPNAVMLGGFAALTRTVQLASINKAIGKAFSGAIADMNIAAATESYEFIMANGRPAKEKIAC